VEIAATQLAYGAFVLLPFAVWNWPGITLELGFLGAVSGIASMAGNLLLIMAYALAPATRLAPFVYFQIVIATISGAVVFDDWPNMLSWAGIAVILLCGGLSASRVSRPKAQPG
jgi:drug/metabolite transporter (DMT)-like permease